MEKYCIDSVDYDNSFEDDGIMIETWHMKPCKELQNKPESENKK